VFIRPHSHPLVPGTSWTSQPFRSYFWPDLPGSGRPREPQVDTGGKTGRGPRLGPAHVVALSLPAGAPRSRPRGTGRASILGIGGDGPPSSARPWAPRRSPGSLVSYPRKTPTTGSAHGGRQQTLTGTRGCADRRDSAPRLPGTQAGWPGAAAERDVDTVATVRALSPRREVTWPPAPRRRPGQRPVDAGGIQKCLDRRASGRSAGLQRVAAPGASRPAVGRGPAGTRVTAA